MSNLLLLFLHIAATPPFPDADGFPERPPDAALARKLDAFDGDSEVLVRRGGKARVRYASGRVATLYACRAIGVKAAGVVEVKMYGQGKLVAVRLAGVKPLPIEPYTDEQAYGWKGGPLVDRTDGGRTVSLAELERGSLLVDTLGEDLWAEFEAVYPDGPGPVAGRLYSVDGAHDVAADLVATGYAHADPAGREGARLQKLQDAAAREGTAGLWDEGRWRDQQAKGFAFMKRPPRGRSTAAGAAPRPRTPSRRGR